LLKEGKGWLIDFGMAMPSPQLPDRRGTRGFRAPEVLRKSKVQTEGENDFLSNRFEPHYLCQF